MFISDYIDALLAKGVFCFSGAEASDALGSGVIATRAALRRLRHKGEVAMPYRGFYVIVPPEYRKMGCLPANQFIPLLMDYLKEPYYAGMLTAAEHYGAAHQRPQAFQVLLQHAQSDVHLFFELLQKMQQLFYDPVHSCHKYCVSVWIKKIYLVQTSLKAG